jgi:hypothetical protein
VTQQPEQVPIATEENIMAALESVPSGETSNEVSSEVTTDQVPSVEEPVVTTKKSDGSNTVRLYFYYCELLDNGSHTIYYLIILIKIQKFIFSLHKKKTKKERYKIKFSHQKYSKTQFA